MNFPTGRTFSRSSSSRGSSEATVLRKTTNKNGGDHLDILRQARQAVKQTNQKASKMQNQTTQQLLQRVKDLKYWTSELDREIHDVFEETDELNLYRNRLNRAMEVSGEAAGINQESMGTRQKRIVEATGSWGTDQVDAELKKETKITADILKTMKETLLEAGKQIDRNKTTQNKLQRDLTLKREAMSLDSKSVSLSTAENSPGHAGAAEDLSSSTSSGSLVPVDLHGDKLTAQQEWIETMTANLNASSKERVRTRKQVQTIQSLMKDSSNHLRAQAQQVEAALKDSLKSLGETRQSLTTQIRSRDKEIGVTDQAIAELKSALKQKERPFQVAQARYEERKKRPGAEHCSDKAHEALVAELTVLRDTINMLTEQLGKANETKAKLEEDKSRLLGKQEICEQNIKLDSDILRKTRSRFPQEIQLTGFMFTEVKQHRKNSLYED